LLSDVQMPEMDGLEATRAIIERWNGDRPRIVAMTAEAMAGDRERCLAAGMDDYITKPIRTEELIAAIERTPRRGSGGLPSTDGGTGNGVIDTTVLVRLAEGTGGDASFVSELIDQFVADAPGLVEAARTGLANGDAQEIRRAAHTLKSNAATFGAQRLTDSSKALEDAARQGLLDGAPQLADVMARELDTVLERLPAAWNELSMKASTSSDPG
jgi:DNA-binding response OmpR family regulator